MAGFRIKGAYKKFDETVASIDCWYDRHTRLWVLQKLNKDGFQIGDAEYIYGKADAMERKAEAEKELRRTRQ